MQIIKKCKQLTFTTVASYLMLLLPLMLLGLGVAHAAPVDPSKDMLNGVKTDVNNNFGLGSSFMYVVFVVEIIGAIAAYIKTKNLFALAGIVVLIIFTATAFLIIGS